MGQQYGTTPADLIEETNPFKRWTINFWAAKWGIQLENSRQALIQKKLRNG